MATYVTTVAQYLEGQWRDAGYEFSDVGFRQGAIQRMLSQGLIRGGGGGGGGGAWTELDRWEHTSDVASIDFTDIDQTYTDLIVRCSLRSDAIFSTERARVQVGDTSIDTGSSYNWEYFRQGTDTTSNASGSTATFALMFGPLGAGATAGAEGFFDIIIGNYATTGQWRQMTSPRTLTRATASVRNASEASALWMNTTDAISRVRITPEDGTNWIAGLVVLYGR